MGLAILSFAVGIALLFVPNYYRKQITTDLMCKRTEASQATIMCELEEEGRLYCLGIVLGGFCTQTLLLTNQGVIAIGVAAEPMLIYQINNYVEKPDDTIFEGNGLQIRNGKLTFHKEWSAGLPMIFPVICLLPSLLILIAIIVKNRRNIIAGFIIRD